MLEIIRKNLSNRESTWLDQLSLKESVPEADLPGRRGDECR